MNFINHSEFKYTRLSLFTWSCNSSPNKLSQSNVAYFATCIKEQLDVDTEVLLVNCNNIIDIDDRVIDPLTSYLNDPKRSVIFYSNVELSKVVDYLHKTNDSEKINSCKVILNDSIKCFYTDNHSLTESKISAYIKEAEEHEKKWILKQIKSSYTKFSEPKLLSSTPLQAPGEFNATTILSDPSLFRWISVLMAEAIHKVVLEERVGSYNIIAASLRGAVIAGSVWELLHYKSTPLLHIVDHMGPRHDIIDLPFNNSKLNTDYCIYVGDFIIAGTEVKVANAYCNMLGGKIRHAFVLGNYIRHESIGKDIKLHGLANLQDCIESLSYKLR